MARELADQGAQLTLVARSDEELDRAVDDIRARQPFADVLPVTGDVRHRHDAERAIAQAHERFGRIDVLINNAGIIQVGPLHAMTAADFREVMATNFFGTLYTSLAVIPQMRARGDGRIVNITSIGGKLAVPHLLPYSCAKFATVGLSEGMAAELARDGVRVTTVVPGIMRTGSPVNAFFKGEPEREFAWFALESATPLTAVNARRAARRIVRALRHGERYVTISWVAKALRVAHDLAPATTTRVLGVVNRLMPSRSRGTLENVRGMRLTHPFAPSVATWLMNRAAIHNRAFGGRPRPTPSHARRIGLI
jgi:NAD(P)-dependent dehydrogenase (short-subunit alcohol dehydrogenase family)